MSASFELLGTAAPVIIVALMGAGGVYFDYRDWNHGISRKSGRPWKASGSDSQGGRSYTDGAGNYIWLSWIKPRT